MARVEVITGPERRRRWQAVAVELKPVGIMDDAVEDGIGKGRLANQAMPSIDRDLGRQPGAGQNRRADAFAPMKLSFQV
jgi:hypothetical protein